MSNITHLELVQQVREHTPMVEAMARSIVRKLPSSVECDDLVQDGQVALIGAILSVSKKITQAHFKNYVAMRVHGAMLDGLREMDHGSRQLRREMRAVELAIQNLTHRLGRAPREREVAASLEMPLLKYQRMLQEASGYVLISLDDIIESDQMAALPAAGGDSDPLKVLERAALRESLMAAMARLSVQSSTVLRMYYLDEAKMHEIGAMLDVSEARVSQIHAQAIAELRARMVDGTGDMPVLKPRRAARVASAQRVKS